MLRLGQVIGLAVGGSVGYLCSFDTDTSLGAVKIPFYVAMGATYGWLIGAVGFHLRPDDPPAGRDAELVAAVARAEAAEAEVERLQARVAELERRG